MSSFDTNRRPRASSRQNASGSAPLQVDDHDAVRRAITSRGCYPSYTARLPLAPHDELVDQQLGGLVMWIPSGVSMVASALALLVAWLGQI